VDGSASCVPCSASRLGAAGLLEVVLDERTGMGSRVRLRARRWIEFLLGQSVRGDGAGGSEMEYADLRCQEIIWYREDGLVLCLNTHAERESVCVTGIKGRRIIIFREIFRDWRRPEWDGFRREPSNGFFFLGINKEARFFSRASNSDSLLLCGTIHPQWTASNC
jgi:hypothetical protein